MPSMRRRSSADPGALDTSQLTPEEQTTWAMPVQPQPLMITPQEQPEDPADSATDRIAQVLEHIAGADKGRVKLYRIDPSTKKLQWCDDYTPADFETGGLSMIRTTWGPGDYKIDVYGPIPNGKAGKPGFGKVGGAQVNVAAAIGGAPAAVQQGGTDLTRVLETMQSNQQAFQQQVLQVLTERPAPPDPMEQMRNMLTMMTLMREAMGLNASAPAKSSITEIVEAIKELRGAASEVLPEKGDSDNPMAMLPAVLDLVKTGMQQRPVAVPMTVPQQPLPPLPPIQVPPAVMPGTHASPTQETAADMSFTPAEIQQMQNAIPELVKRAERKADPVDTADWLVDNMPDPVLELLETDDWLQLLLYAAPQFEVHQEWLQLVRAAYIEIPVEGADDANSGDQSATGG